MMLKQSTSTTIMIFMTDSTDHVSGKTGLTLTITASKAGGAFSGYTNTVTDRGSGWYSLLLDTTITDTPGVLVFHVTGTGADPTDISFQVIAFDLGVATQPVNITQWNSNTLMSGKKDLGIVHQGTLQAGSTSTTAKLATGALADDNVYNYLYIVLISGTGADQAPRLILDYDGGTKVATVYPAWDTTPDGSTGYFLAHAGSAVDLRSWKGDQTLISLLNYGGEGAPQVSLAAWNGLELPALITGANQGPLASSDLICAGSVTSATATTLVAAASVYVGSAISSVDDYYNDQTHILITAGPGAGQVRYVTDYVGSTRTFTIDAAWTTNPTGSSKYALLAGSRSSGTVNANLVSVLGTAVPAPTVAGIPKVEVSSLPYASLDTALLGVLGVVRRNTAVAGGAATAIVLDASASATDDDYNGYVVYLASGTGAGQERMIIDYVGATKTATVDRAWATNPDGTTIFVIMSGRHSPYGSVKNLFETNVEGTNSFEETIRLLTAVLCGKVADFETGPLEFKSLDGTKIRLTVVATDQGRTNSTVGDLS